MAKEKMMTKTKSQKRIESLETPFIPRRGLRPSYDAERFGEIAERFARFIGTARFLVYMSAFVVGWVGWNLLGPSSLRIDEYPFIFLTLLLSLQASYAAPLILLAQNRQADRDRVSFQEDRVRDERTQADAEFLTREIASLRAQVQSVATKEFVRGEFQELLEELLAQMKKDQRSGKDS
jgi:uncharacterized membrane protein